MADNSAKAVYSMYPLIYEQVKLTTFVVEFRHGTLYIEDLVLFARQSITSQYGWILDIYT
jgi:hypothetical protein